MACVYLLLAPLIIVCAQQILVVNLTQIFCDDQGTHVEEGRHMVEHLLPRLFKQPQLLGGEEARVGMQRLEGVHEYPEHLQSRISVAHLLPATCLYIHPLLSASIGLWVQPGNRVFLC